MSNDGVAKLSPFTHETWRLSDDHGEGVEAVRHRNTGTHLGRLRDGARAGVLARRRVDLFLRHRRRVDDFTFRHEPGVSPFLLGLALLRSGRIQGRLPRLCGSQKAFFDGGLLLPFALVDVVGDVKAVCRALDDGTCFI